jgi:hypothetical protein
MNPESRQSASLRSHDERLASLANVGAELGAQRMPGEQPPTWSLRLADGRPFATFGVIDATYFWSFDGGESMHYAKDRNVMRRLLTTEFSKAMA